MQATSEQIAALKKLQHIDTLTSRLQKELDELPQKQAIIDIRHKKSDIQQKRKVVEKALEETSQDLQKTLDELSDTERLIDEKSSYSSSNFRSAEAAEKTLEAAYTHHEELSDKRKDLSAKHEETAKLLAHVDEALEKLNTRERTLVESYRKKGGALTERIEKAQTQRASLAHIVGDKIVDTYKRIAKAKGGVGISQLNGSTCSVCRSTFDQGHVLKIYSEAPLSKCPACGRLMIIESKNDNEN